KHWHYKILDNPPKAKNVFEKVHRPSRRQIVLNSLFIKNITDVLSTGDVAPEVMGYGIEITRVKISPCCKILNVYWQVPPNSFSLCEDIETKLNSKARAIRAEIISRNLMGKVPHIFFIRDHTNARLAAFESALKDVEAEIKEDSPIVLDEAFLEDILAFNSAKKMHQEIEEKPVPVIEKEPDDSPMYPPPRPSDMKCDVFGLRHDVMMDRVMAAKKKNEAL
ncbi:putative ribosome-binding factor A, mitochondrial, partial [Uloborus diversus]|uniref:putative ribosome-binding factor A, mitochondrial n=1 Tax=Uloborus diversus TaxID=327109 RepID=UPI002409184E